MHIGTKAKNKKPKFSHKERKLAAKKKKKKERDLGQQFRPNVSYISLLTNKVR